MSRAFGAASAAAFIEPNVSVITFVMLDFASGIVRVHNSLGTYTWGGEDWVGVGSLGTVSQLEEGADVSPYGITLTLSALDAVVSGAALNEDYFMRPVEIYIGALSADDVLLNTPLQMWAGHMDVMDVTAGAENDQITIKCESELSAFDRSSNLKYTTQSQQDFYAGDLFFNFLPKIEGAKIRWRDKDSDSIAGTPSSGSSGRGRGRGRDKNGSQQD
tara:strand:- start:62 stop:712 length:651 start_codon:yes stop_codon:yes gene_type:complete